MSRGREYLGLALIVCFTILPPLLLYPFPSQDGHQHAFTAFAFSRIDAAEWGFAPYLESQVPFSSQGYVFLLIFFDSFLGFLGAERVALATTLALFPVVGAVYARLSGRSPLAIAGGLSLLAYGWALPMGFYNFMLAAALLPLAVAFAQRPTQRPVVQLVLLGAILVGLAWLHLMVAAFAGLLCFIVGRHRVGVIIAGLPSAAYAAWVGSSYVETNRPIGAITPLEPYYEPVSQRLTDLFFVGPGGVSVVAGAVLVLLALVAVVAPGKRSRVLALTGAALCAAFLFAPVHAARWAFLSPRLVFGGLLALILALPAADRFGEVRARAVTMAVFVLVSAGLGHAGYEMASLHETLRPETEATLAVRRDDGPLLSLELEETPFEGLPRYMEPTLHLGLRALLATGGTSPYLFAINPSIHAISFAHDPIEQVGPAPGVYLRRGFRCGELDDRECVAAQTSVSDRLAYYGAVWGELLLYHPPILLQTRLRERGFRLALDAEGVQHWIARPSRIELTIVPREGVLRSPVVVRVGYPDSVGWVTGARLRPGPVADGRVTIPLETLLAGELHVQVFRDDDGDGEPQRSEFLPFPGRLRVRAGQSTSYTFELQE